MNDEFDQIEDDGNGDNGDGNTSAPSWTTEAQQTFQAAADPTHYIRFITTDGAYNAPTVDGQPMTLSAACTAANLRFNNASVFEMDGAQIGMDTMIQPGSTITALSAVKGG
jgi:hypothetical protein